MKTPQPHPYAALLRAIADGCRLERTSTLVVDGPWKPVTFTNELAGGILRGETMLSNFRIAQNTRRIGEFDVPYGLSEADDLSYGTDTWFADPVDGVKEVTFENEAWIRRLRDLGFLHRTREAAELHVKALRSL